MMTKFMMAVVLLLAGYVAGRLSSPSAVLSASQPAAAGHVYELRTYTAAEGKLANVNARFRDNTRRIFEKHNMTSIGYWTPLEGATAETTLIYLLEHPSREEARKNWAAFSADPEWQKVKAESETGGRIVAKAESVFLNPTDYSALK
ncbi:MAG: NIPSNAP family protein [Vicinamibacterales bacterium]